MVLTIHKYPRMEFFTENEEKDLIKVSFVKLRERNLQKAMREGRLTKQK